MNVRRCSDPLNKGCLTILRRDNDDGVCGPCAYTERTRLAKPAADGRRDRKQVIRDYLADHVSSPSMIGATLGISYTEVKRMLQQLQADGSVRKVEAGGPGKAAKYTAAAGDDMPGAA